MKVKHKVGQFLMNLTATPPKEEQVTKAECNARVSIPLGEAEKIWKEMAQARQ